MEASFGMSLRHLYSGAGTSGGEATGVRINSRGSLFDRVKGEEA